MSPNNILEQNVTASHRFSAANKSAAFNTFPCQQRFQISLSPDLSVMNSRAIMNELSALLLLYKARHLTNSAAPFAVSKSAHRAEKYSLDPLGSGFMVTSPGFQPAGQTSSGFSCTYWMACSVRMVSSTLRPNARLLIVACWITPCTQQALQQRGHFQHVAITNTWAMTLCQCCQAFTSLSTMKSPRKATPSEFSTWYFWLISRFRSDTRGYFKSPTPPSLRSRRAHISSVLISTDRACQGLGLPFHRL